MTAEWDDLARLAEAAKGHSAAAVANFRAAANPATILRLIDALDSAGAGYMNARDLSSLYREERDALAARLAAVEALAAKWDEKAVVLARQSESRAGLSDAAALAAAAEFYAARAANLRAALAAPTDTTKEN